MSDPSEYEEAYTEESFWQKLTGFARAAGIEVVEKALLLYYTAQEDSTPTWAKATIVGALGYFISFVDAVPDLTPFIGYTDDLGVLAMALATISAYITPAAEDKAKRKVVQWFGDDEKNSGDSEGSESDQDEST